MSDWGDSDDDGSFERDIAEDLRDGPVTVTTGCEECESKCRAYGFCRCDATGPAHVHVVGNELAKGVEWCSVCGAVRFTTPGPNANVWQLPTWADPRTRASDHRP